MAAKNGSIKLVAGNSNPALAQAIAEGLNLPLTKASVRRFADNEIFVEVLENVRGSDAFIIQSTSYPANGRLMELLIITDAVRRCTCACRTRKPHASRAFAPSPMLACRHGKREDRDVCLLKPRCAPSCSPMTTSPPHCSTRCARSAMHR